MKIVNGLVAGMCVGLLASPGWAQAGKGLTPADGARIKEVGQIQVKAILAKDWTTMTTQYIEDAVVYPPNEPPAKGRVAICAFVERIPPVTAMEVVILTAEGRDDVAYVLGTYTMTIAAPGGPPVKDSGKLVEVRRRQPDGKWPLAVDMFSSNRPAAPSK